MGSYSYRAIDQGSTILSGRLSARDESELERLLSVQGITLIEAKKSSIFEFSFNRGMRFSDEELLNFTFVLHLIVTSGIAIMDGLMDMTRNKEKKKLSRAAELIYQKIEAGQSLSSSMQELPLMFPYYYVQMVKAGESSGNLDSVLNDLMSYIEWQIGFKKTTRAAMTYPAMVLGAVVLLVILLFSFVFPRLLTILTGLNAELPMQTRVLIWISSFFRDYFVFIIGGAFGIFALLKVWGRTEFGRMTIDRFILGIPLFGDLIKKINLSRYFKAFGTLYNAGVSMEQTFAIAAGVVQNSIMHKALLNVTDSVMSGEGISASMQKTGIFPSLIIDMVSVGEKTGNLDNVAFRASSIFDKEVPEVFKKFMTYVEPVVIMLLGGIILFVLLSIFLPIYKIVGGIRVR